ncbi:hypothetical protein [Nostoc sp. T09]|nr:hypothetical protein [Nostoc sp. T09]
MNRQSAIALYNLNRILGDLMISQAPTTLKYRMLPESAIALRALADN